MRDPLFDVWMTQVDERLATICGLPSGDLPDMPYYDMFDGGTTPEDAACDALEVAGFPMEELVQA